jgi:hypothetical protein
MEREKKVHALQGTLLPSGKEKGNILGPSSPEHRSKVPTVTEHI